MALIRVLIMQILFRTPDSLITDFFRNGLKLTDHFVSRLSIADVHWITEAKTF